MGKKIVILNGSNKKSSTGDLIESFTNGATSVGNEVKLFNLNDMNIMGCISCNSDESICAIKDDMDLLLEPYQEADIVVIASPMYYWSISGRLKCVFDRLLAIKNLNKVKNNSFKQCVLLVASEKASAGGFEPVNDFYESIVKTMGWHSIGAVYEEKDGGISSKSNYLGIEEAKVLGESIH